MWRVERSRSQFSFLPVSITHSTYKQIELRVEERNIDEYIDSLIRESMLQNALRPVDGNLKAVHTIAKIQDNLLMANIHIWQK